MSMYRIIVTHIAILIISFTSQAQTMLWPIAGKTAGENILSQPQSYIGDELNGVNLFIGAESGAYVLCPADGIITSVGASYQRSLSFMLRYGGRESLSVTENVLAARQKEGLSYTGSIMLRLSDGYKLYLQGFISDQCFKTGQKLSRGDTLGLVDYSYMAFRNPSLLVAISAPGGRPGDPMTPFGLKTSFMEPQAITRKNPLPAEQVREDLDVLKEAFCELYPSLSDRMGVPAFRAQMDSLKAFVTAPMDVPKDFRIMLRGILHQIPDSHVGLYPDPVPPSVSKDWSPGEFLMFCDDTVRILFTVPEYKKYEGKVVNRINGIPAADFAKQAEALLFMYDDGVESTPEEERFLLGRYGVMMHPHARKGDSHELELEDGNTVRIPFCERPRFTPTDTYRRMLRWHNLNRLLDDDGVFQTQVLNDSTAYLGIKTFELLTAQVDQIRAFLDTLKAPNLIVDVRNNAGGRSDVLMNLLSCFAAEPMGRQKGGYGRVNKRGQFASLAHSLNYSADADIFPDYQPGENGFYTQDTLETCAVVLPDPQVHYPGKVYVLTNGSSMSSATLFPAVLVRNRRGVSIGRETGSGYHYMTANKFADLQLPHSLQTIRIPLVKMVFDTTACARLPKGRGLLPDYPLKLTYNEAVCGADGETDVMLEYALSLIAEGKYLSNEDPFAETDKLLIFNSPSLIKQQTSVVYVFLSVLLGIILTWIAARLICYFYSCS